MIQIDWKRDSFFFVYIILVVYCKCFNLFTFNLLWKVFFFIVNIINKVRLVIVLLVFDVFIFILSPNLCTTTTRA